MRPPSAAQSRAGAVAPAPRGFPVVACPDSIARDTRCLLLTHTSITAPCESASIRQLYAYLPSRDFSQSVLATRPPSLAVLPVTGVAWCDLGEPRRVVAMRACLNAAPARPGRGGLMSA